MIKEVIKRDGRIEAFVPGKLNRWGTWAAEGLGDLVDWSKVVMRAAADLPARTTTEELQEKLIQIAMEQGTWSYYVMAGRLYAAHIRKIIYESDKVPTVQALHEKLLGLRLMRELDYSEAEYIEIESFIDHGRDFSVPHFSLHHLRRKYALMNRVTGSEYESQQFTYMRMAMTLSENEPKDVRLKHVKNFYNYLSLKKLSAPTPNFVNLGTPLESYASCCLYASDDDAKSLAIGDHIAYMMTVSSAGIGSNIMTRSINDPVRGGVIAHQGRLPYYRSKGKAVLANLQNGRGGAGTAFFTAFDPEVETILQLRNVRNTEDKKIRDLHYAMLMNPWFAKKVAENEDIFLFNPFTAPDLNEKFYSPDLKGFVELYQKYEADPNFKKTYVSARSLLYTSFSEAYETGTAYIANIHEMNRHTPFKEPIYSSNLCVAPETLLLTDKGEFPIHQLVDQHVRVWNGEQWSQTIVRKTGDNQPLLEVSLDRTTLHATPYHKWYVLRNGVEVEVRTHELITGDILTNWFTPEGNLANAVVNKVTDNKRTDDTYCVNEPIRHRVIFNGVLTGQCMEISEPTKPYYDMQDLYSSEDHGRGEIATCNLAAIVKENIESDEEYGEVMYYALKMIDYCILNSKYVFPHLATTAKARMNAGVGVMGYAVHMARNGLKYSSVEGKIESHRSAETHMYHAIRASLRISKERGLAPWMHKTKWPEGWLPLDTYNKNVDTLADFQYERDWESLRQEIIENGGIGHSVLVAHMPGEASSKAAGTSNSLYPVRELTLVKTDNGISTRWAAPFGDNPEYEYEFAWDVGSLNMLDHYAIWQKFTDQAISADLWRRVPAGATISTEEIRREYLHMVKMGVKTRYYQNTQTSAGIDLEGNATISSETVPGADEVCDTCTL